MKDNDNTFAKILIADEIRRQDQQRLSDQYRRDLISQQEENVKQQEKAKKESEKLIEDANSEARANAYESVMWRKKYEDAFSGFLNRAYTNLYQQNMLYGARFLLLNLAKEMKIPEEIMIKISLLSAHKYMTNPDPIPEGLSNYLNKYSDSIKDNHYEILLNTGNWKKNYENRLYKTIRDARGEIAKYVLSQKEMSPFVINLLASLDSRFININEMQLMLNDILAEQKAEQDEKDKIERIKQATLKKEQDEINQKLQWAKEEQEFFEKEDIVIYQGKSTPNLYSEHINKNWDWIHLLRFLSRATVSIEQGNMKNEGTFFNPNKKAPLSLRISVNKEKDPEIGNYTFSCLKAINPIYTDKEAYAYFSSEKNSQIYSFGYCPKNSKIEKIQMELLIIRKNDKGEIVKTKHSFIYILSKPFIVS